MNVKISKRFVKDTQKITDPRILTKIRHVLIESNAIKALYELPNVTEMSG
jgi:hypothetical protein